jgi:hypothetical protein
MAAIAAPKISFETLDVISSSARVGNKTMLCHPCAEDWITSHARFLTTHYLSGGQKSPGIRRMGTVAVADQ